MRSRGTRYVMIAAGGLAATIAVGPFFCGCHSAHRQHSQIPDKDDVSECRVTFCEYEEHPYACVWLDEPSQIDSLVLQPMKHAKHDSDPAERAFFGMLTITTLDGRYENLSLFAPWGHYRYRDKYYIADFTKLQAACDTALNNAQYPMEAERQTAGATNTSP